MVAYRAEMVIWVLSATLPLVMLSLWNSAAAGGPVGGYSQVDFTRYFTVNLVVRQLTGSWIVWELNWNIRKGDLSPRLLRPMHPLVFNFCETLAALPFRAAILFPLVGALALWRPELLFVPSPTAAAGFCASVFLAFVLAWTIQAIFGMLAFWFDQSMGFWSAWFAIWALAAGYFVPLDLFPDGWVSFFRVLPFYATLGAPIDVVLGRAAVLPVLLWQAAWVAAAATVGIAMWRAGIRRYGAVGA
jgi:ABC-2 type transport system permease protein